MTAAGPHLFSPLAIGPVTVPNRVMVSPMCTYRAVDGRAGDFHLVHLGRFALGGAGLVMVEATAVSPAGRISHHDLGLWEDDQVPALARVIDFLHSYGAVAGVQLAHAGRKASVTAAWAGGRPLGPEDADRGEPPWPTVGPSAVAPGAGWPTPHELTPAEVEESVADWAAAAERAVRAGADVVELHGAHGYLLHAFLSPLSNRRDDAWGGDAERRLRYPLAVVRAVREAIGPDRALGYRLSATDGLPEGLGPEEALTVAQALVAAGVDLVDVSSGALSTDRVIDSRVRRTYGFHADLARGLREALPVPVASGGLVVDPHQAEALVAHGDLDLVSMGRELLEDPHWAHCARQALGDPSYDAWHVEVGGALAARARTRQKLAEAGEAPGDRARRFTQ